MPYSTHQNRTSTVHGRVVSPKRGDRLVFRHLQALSEQGPFTPTNDVPRVQGVGQLSIGRYYDDPEYYQGHGCRRRRTLQGQRNTSSLQNH